VGYNSVADNAGLFVYHLFGCYCLGNTRNVAKFQENLTIQAYSSSRSSKVIDLGVNGKPIGIVTHPVIGTFVINVFFLVFAAWTDDVIAC